MSSRTLRIAASATSTFALIAAGIAATSSAATAAPDPIGAMCPDVFPADDLTGGQRVTGLTTAGAYVDESDNFVSSSETPEQFTGTFLGTIQDDSGDLLAFKLKGSRITKSNGDIDAGVWSGMSGSPVYSEDGRLIGAVSYTFGEDGSSEFAGVTPAADMYDLLDSRPTRERQAGAPKTIKLSSSEKAVMVKKGVAAASANQLRRLDPVPAIGAGNKFVKPATIAKIARMAKAPEPSITNSGGSTQTRDIPIVPGANLAVANSYGSLPSYGVGTATAICGDQVLAFGHPMNWGPSSMTMHGASTVAVQAAGAYSFKIANLGAPNGVLVKDDLNGILGQFAEIANYPKVTSKTNGQSSVSTVPQPAALSMVAAMQVYRDAALALKQDAGGESTVSWKIDFVRKNGVQQSFTRSNRYSSNYSIAEELMMGVATDIETIQGNDFEDVKITNITIDNAVNTSYRALQVKRIKVLSKSGWKTKSKSGSKLEIRAGKTLKVALLLEKTNRFSTATPVTKYVSYKIPKSARGRAFLNVVGNAGGYYESDYEDCEMFDECEDYSFEDEGEAPPRTFDQLIKKLKAEPRQDVVNTTIDLSGRTRAVSSYQAPAVVSGEFTVKLNITK